MHNKMLIWGGSVHTSFKDDYIDQSTFVVDLNKFWSTYVIDLSKSWPI